MTNEQLKFINDIGEAARSYYDKYQILPSLVVAMAIKESGWGKSQLAAKNHNYFGMKWTTKCGTKYVEYNTKEFDKASGKYVTIKAKFRSFDTLADGIKGFYDFISGYKRYANLIGEKSAAVACQKIQVDGWATAPNYATSLYNDYILKYNLTRFDGVEASEDPAEFVKGRIYVTDNDLYIRTAPMGVKKKMYELTVNAKIHSFPDSQGNAILRKGTRVTCLDIAHDGKSVWLLIPSGYICAVSSSGKRYIIGG